MGRKKENPVYSYFIINSEQNSGRCLVDGCIYTVKAPISGNLEKHLKRHHPYQFGDLLKQKEMIASFVMNRYKSDGPEVPKINSLPNPFTKQDTNNEQPMYELDETFCPIKAEEEHFETSDTIGLTEAIDKNYVNVSETDAKDNEPNSTTVSIPPLEVFQNSTSVQQMTQTAVSILNPVENEQETDAAFCSYILTELQNVRNPQKKRMLKIKIVSEILNAQQG